MRRFRRQNLSHQANRSKSQDAGQASIGNLLAGIFLAGLVITSLLVYSAFVSYRVGAVRDMAQADAQRISHLVFEHLYSVMRKGSDRNELDDLIHHIQNQLPDYEVSVIRGDPVIRQFGDRPGQAELRQKDVKLAEVLATGHDYSGASAANLRYLFPVKVTAECAGCHSMAKVGEINGVISVSVPMSALEAPIAAIAYPIMFIALGLVFLLLLVTFLALRLRVSQPIVDLTEHVAKISQEADYSRDLNIGAGWPKEVGSLAQHFNELMAKVRTSHHQLRQFSLRDPLTDLFNRRHFDAVIEQVAADAANGSSSFAVLLLDLDQFKPINDLYGHAAGDAVLVGVAKALQGALRETDLAARIGGDEFAVIALATDCQSADELASRLRAAVAAPEFRFGHDIVHASCSIGIACTPGDGLLAAELVQVADLAMYADKNSRLGTR